MVKMILIVAAVAALISVNFSNGGDVWDLQVDMESVQNIPFLNGHVPVFKHNSDHRYFIAPYALLRQETAHAHYDSVNRKNEMRFDIEMFSTEAQTVVEVALKKTTLTLILAILDFCPLKK